MAGGRQCGDNPAVALDIPAPSAFMLRQHLSGVAVDYQWVPLERMSSYAALAVIAAEDQTFLDHWGIDLNAVADAIADNRNRPRGASTISLRFFNQPVARLSRQQGATLAAVLPNPKRMFADRPSVYVARRTRQIIQQMNALGGIGTLNQTGR